MHILLCSYPQIVSRQLSGNSFPPCCQALLCREKPMARGIPLVIIGSIGRIHPERARTIAWGSKGPRLCGIGGIGINGVETNYWIMTSTYSLAFSQLPLTFQVKCPCQEDVFS